MLGSKKNIPEKLPEAVKLCTVDDYGEFYLIPSCPDESLTKVLGNLGAIVASGENVVVARLNTPEKNLGLYVKEPINYNRGRVSDRIVFLPEKITRRADLTLLLKNSPYTNEDFQNIQPADCKDSSLNIEKFFDEHKAGIDYIFLKNSLLGPIATSKFDSSSTMNLLLSENSQPYGTMLGETGIDHVYLNSHPLNQDFKSFVKVRNLYITGLLTDVSDASWLSGKAFVLLDGDDSEKLNVFMTDENGYNPHAGTFAIKKF